MQRNLVFNILHKSGLPTVLRHLKRGYITILSLHRISDERDAFFNPLTPRKFEELVKYAVEHYTIVSFAELHEIKTAPKKPVLLFSFDDGYYDFYEFALPILTKFNIPSNHNIVNECANSNQPIWTHRLNAIFSHCKTNDLPLEFCLGNKVLQLRDFNMDWERFYLAIFTGLLQTPKSTRLQIVESKEQELSIGTVARMMGWDEIIECSNNRVEIGSHTYTHDVMSGSLDPKVLEREIVDSKVQIEEKVGQVVEVLALPNGQGDSCVDNFVRSAGFKYLLYVDDAANKIGPELGSDFSVLKRINIVDESRQEMILRTELFHSRVRKYV